ncbi:MAG: hypothetical protein QOI80_67 [Solirubrobacteraceae bacterium]|nr:hypothetical protein [Solirubrobacteraceae bacterium]
MSQLLRWLIPTIFGLAGLACAAVVVWLIACVAVTLQYRDDDYCGTVTTPKGVMVEGGGWTQQLSVVPPKMTCIYTRPHRRRVVIAHKPW